MAFTEFYMQTTGNDTNAGSTNTDAATTSATNGNWDSATGVYISPSGTPFASTSIGDWASIYIDGASAAVFIAQVTAVTSSTQITVSLTVKFGTAPTTSATTRSCKIGGAWASFTGPATPFTTGTTAVAFRVNIKAGAYTHNTITLSLAGTTLLPAVWRGYKTTPGDLDVRPTTNRVNTTDLPFITMNSTFAITFAAFTTLQNLSFTGVRSGSVVAIGNSCHVYQCRFSNTSSNASALAFSAGGAGSVVHCFGCGFTAPTTATNVIALGAINLDNCDLIGGITCVSSSQNFVIRNTTFRGYTTTGVSTATGALRISNCTLVGGTNGIQINGTPSLVSINDCLFSGCTTGINNSSGGNLATVSRVGNAFYNCGTQESGFGDHPSFNAITESSDPLVSSTDLSLKSTALSKGAAGGLFDGESYTSYRDVGAVQRQESDGPAGRLITSRPINRRR